jgi:hypothetical protein
VQAVGVGAPAEFGAFTGAVINTVTKSGGNRFSGVFDVTYTATAWAATTSATHRQAPPGGPRERRLADITTQLSGP